MEGLKRKTLALRCFTLIRILAVEISTLRTKVNNVFAFAGMGCLKARFIWPFPFSHPDSKSECQRHIAEDSEADHGIRNHWHGSSRNQWSPSKSSDPNRLVIVPRQYERTPPESASEGVTSSRLSLHAQEVLKHLVNSSNDSSIGLKTALSHDQVGEFVTDVNVRLLQEACRD